MRFFYLVYVTNSFLINQWKEVNLFSPFKKMSIHFFPTCRLKSNCNRNHHFSSSMTCLLGFKIWWSDQSKMGWPDQPIRCVDKTRLKTIQVPLWRQLKPTALNQKKNSSEILEKISWSREMPIDDTGVSSKQQDPHHQVSSMTWLPGFKIWRSDQSQMDWPDQPNWMSRPNPSGNKPICQNQKTKTI